MVISREEKFAALQEAQRILQLEKKWRRHVPDERKPDFKRAARIVLERALEHETVSKEPELRVHSGLMHQHDESARGAAHRAHADTGKYLKSWVSANTHLA